MADNLLTQALACAALAAAAGSVRIRVRRPRLARPAWIAASLSGLGASIALATTAGALPRRPEPPPRRAGVVPTQPWSETSGAPPLPLVRAGASARPWEGDVVTDRQRVVPAAPAARPQDDPRLVPLFPPWSDAKERTEIERCARERLECMRRHPAGKGLSSYTVREGDTLWAIAARVLGTDDTRRIARYWPAIHKANRIVIGGDPNTIRPGQKLKMPAEVRR